MDALVMMFAGTLLSLIAALNVTILITVLKNHQKLDEYVTIIYDMSLTTEDLADEVWPGQR